jgi:hypothetical protein
MDLCVESEEDLLEAEPLASRVCWAEVECTEWAVAWRMHSSYSSRLLWVVEEEHRGWVEEVHRGWVEEVYGGWVEVAQPHPMSQVEVVPEQADRVARSPCTTRIVAALC